MSYQIELGLLGRWFIANARWPKLAWSGSRWVEHVGGVGVIIQVANFETEKEASDYARGHLNG